MIGEAGGRGHTFLVWWEEGDGGWDVSGRDVRGWDAGRDSAATRGSKGLAAPRNVWRAPL